MINVFGFKMGNKNEGIDVLDGDCFVTERIDEGEAKSIDLLNAEYDEQIKHSRLPLYLRIIKYVCSLLALIAVASIIKADVPIDVAFGNAPYIFIAGGASIVIAIALWIIEAVKRNEYLNGEEFRKYRAKEAATAKRLMTKLMIPEDARLIDVLAEGHKGENNDAENESAREAKPQFIPIEMFAYKDEGGFHLADCSGVFTFPLDEIIGVSAIESKATLLCWNKTDSIRSEKYKDYKMSADGLDRIHIKNYYSLAVRRDETDYEILIPAYEINTVASLLDLEITVNEEN